MPPVLRLTSGSLAGRSGKYHLPYSGTFARFNAAASSPCWPAQVICFGSRTIAFSSSRPRSRQEVDGREDDDPDDIDEVPVQTGDLDKERLLAVQASRPGHRRHVEQPEDADRHVG